MSNNKNSRADHDTTDLPTALEGLRDADFVTSTVTTNDILKEIRLSDNAVRLVFTRTIRNQPSGEIVSIENVHESHPLAELGDRVMHNVMVMVAAAKINATASVTRQQFFKA